MRHDADHQQQQQHAVFHHRREALDPRIARDEVPPERIAEEERPVVVHGCDVERRRRDEGRLAPRIVQAQEAPVVVVGSTRVRRGGDREHARLRDPCAEPLQLGRRERRLLDQHRGEDRGAATA
jgi:hypothetical protein